METLFSEENANPYHIHCTSPSPLLRNELLGKECFVFLSFSVLFLLKTTILLALYCGRPYHQSRHQYHSYSFIHNSDRLSECSLATLRTLCISLTWSGLIWGGGSTSNGGRQLPDYWRCPARTGRSCRPSRPLRLSAAQKVRSPSEMVAERRITMTQGLV